MGGLDKFRANEVFHENDIDIQKETFRNIVTSKIYQLMAIENINKKNLADLINVSKSAITTTLSGDRNFTIDKVTEISSALGYIPVINFKKKDMANTFIQGYLIASIHEDIQVKKELKIGPISVSHSVTRSKKWHSVCLIARNKEYT